MVSMFDACEGCGGIPNHKLNGPVCVQIRAERVRAAQLVADELDRRADAENKVDLPHELMVD